MGDGLTPAQKARKEYTELLKEITEKYNKPEADEYVKKEEYDVLKEDLEYYDRAFAGFVIVSPVSSTG